MESRNFYNEILTDHNLHPVHKEGIPDANLVLEGLNPSCGDQDRKSTRLNSSHPSRSRMPSSA